MPHRDTFISKSVTKYNQDRRTYIYRDDYREPSLFSQVPNSFRNQHFKYIGNRETTLHRNYVKIYKTFK